MTPNQRFQPTALALRARPAAEARRWVGDREEAMTMTKQQVGVWLFAAISIISFVAALIPVLKGDGPNVVFLGTGTVFLVIAIAIAKKSRTRGNGPSTG
jgi:hypothetical protein